MRTQLMKLQSSSRIARILCAGCLLALFVTGAGAQTTPDVLGELLVAKEVAINSVQADAGLTIISGSRIQIGASGRATVNLGQLGRVKIGPNSDLALTFSANKISGELRTGWAVVSAAKGVEASVNTAEGVVVSDGKDAAVLTVNVVEGVTRVESVAEAQLTTREKKVEKVAAGEEVTMMLYPEDRELSVSRRSVGGSVGDGAGFESRGLGALLARSVRGAADTVTVNRTMESARSNTAALTRGFHSVDAGDTRVLERIENQMSPIGPFPGCDIFPKLVVAKPGCVTNFSVYFTEVPVTSTFTIRPFFPTACFLIQPGSPQQLQVGPGHAYAIVINSLSCPTNAGQLPQNSLIVIESDTCGSRTVQIAWSTPCRTLGGFPV